MSIKTVLCVVICALVIFTAKPASAETIWEDYSIELNSGNTIYAVLERNQDCYSLLVGSNNTNISGNASNCSNSLKESVWVISACGERQTLSYHGPWDAIQEIVKMCN